MHTRSKLARFAVPAAFSLFLTACIVPKIHKTNEFTNETGVQTLAIDAKQRVVVFAKRPDPNPQVAAALATAAANAGSGDRGLISVTCAEPSPDALSALSTSVGGGLQDPKVAANFAVAVSESTASIGLRTQSIQLLRDGMYRLCEGYAAGAIDAPEFNRQQRRYQNLMLSLLAIEQLTGAVVPRQVGLGDGSASSSVGDNADQAAADATAATNAVTDAQTALTKSQMTQTADANACTAAAPDTTNAGCTKAAPDKADVDAKTSDLATAKKKDDTAKQVLQAARSAVKAAATGAHVSFSDAPKTNGITDGSARYIAEATRTIVGTTLIASFAQEECSRLWDYVTKAPPDEKIALLAALDEHKSKPEKFGIQELFNNCRDSQQNLLSRTAMFTPDYGAPAPPTLLVIGADTAIPLGAGGAAVDLRIVGGTPPYDAIVTPALKPELEATVPPAKGAVRTVHISRPAGATKTGSASVTIIDANNAHVEIPITLAAKTPDIKPTAVAVPTNIVAKDGGGGKITVTFTPPPKSDLISKITAKAVNADPAKKTDILTSDGTTTSNSIDIPGCTAGNTYDVTVSAVLTTGDPATGKAPNPVACTTAPPLVTAPPKTPGPPPPPTNVAGTAVAGAKITVSFTPSIDDGGGAVTAYTATATDMTPGQKEKPLIGTADAKTTSITLSGCKTSDTYTVWVIATRDKQTSSPGLGTNNVLCLK